MSFSIPCELLIQFNKLTDLCYLLAAVSGMNREPGGKKVVYFFVSRRPFISLTGMA